MKKGLIALIIILVAVGIIILSIISSYNNLVTADETVQTAFSQIENQLQRRNDLIPNLVNTVKGYAAQEKEIFENVAQARSKLAGASTVSDIAAADTEVSGALSRLLAIVENYPELKSDKNFQQLSDELAGTENRIAVARKDYNDEAKLYNTKIRKFPTSLIAGIFNFVRHDYFEAEDKANEVPDVDFSK